MSPSTTFRNSSIPADVLYKRVYYIYNNKVIVFYDPNRLMAVVTINYINELQPQIIKFSFERAEDADNWEHVTHEGSRQMILAKYAEEKLEYDHLGLKVH